MTYTRDTIGESCQALPADFSPESTCLSNFQLLNQEGFEGAVPILRPFQNALRPCVGSHRLTGCPYSRLYHGHGRSLCMTIQPLSVNLYSMKCVKC